MRKSVLLLSGMAFVLCVCGEVWSYPPDYGPFEAGEEPRGLEIYKLGRIEPEDADIHTEGVSVYGRKGKKSMSQVCLIRYPAVSQGVFVKVLNSQGEVVFGSQQVSNGTTPIIYCMDLNRDKKEDFIVRAWLAGCGLAGNNCDITFILSEGSGYKSTVVRDLWPTLEDFVNFNGDEKYEYVHTSLVRGEKGRDGKTHNYWVYNILEFKGADVVVNNKADKRFPKWIWYTFKPNHKATTQLTSEQKQRLWKPHSERIFLQPKQPLKEGDTRNQREEKQTFETSGGRGGDFRYSYYSQLEDTMISLRIHEITSLPGGEIFLGGSYYGRASTIHTVLLVSQDGGNTWKDAGFKVDGCGVMNFQTFGLSHVWAIATYLTEGCRSPVSLLRSTDAGQNWSSVSLNFIDQMSGLDWIGQFQFFDEQRGLLVITDSLDTYMVYITFDGGKNWEKIMISKKDDSNDIGIERYQQDYGRGNINKAALWKKNLHSYKISGWIRVRETDSPGEPYIVIESQGVDRKGWKQISQIPRYYKVENDSIIPVDSSKRENSRVKVKMKSE